MGINDKIDQAKGKVREEYGKATGDKTDENRGKAEQIKAKIGDAADDVKDKATDAADDVKDAVTR
jgi:uncharacterized protein YjbJ (UPF0337 family)